MRKATLVIKLYFWFDRVSEQNEKAAMDGLILVFSAVSGCLLWWKAACTGIPGITLSSFTLENGGAPGWISLIVFFVVDIV